jgi:hypothetical protein
VHDVEPCPASISTLAAAEGAALRHWRRPADEAFEASAPCKKYLFHKGFLLIAATERGLGVWLRRQPNAVAAPARCGSTKDVDKQKFSLREGVAGAAARAHSSRTHPSRALFPSTCSRFEAR